MNMDIFEFMQLLNKALEKCREERAWDTWLSIYPHMTKRNFMSFEDYKAKVMPAKIENMATAEEIFRDVTAIRNKVAEGG